MREVLLVGLLFCVASIVEPCTLCHLRTPPRPRPLDQYKLPTMGAANFEKMPKFCNVSKTLPVDEACRVEFEKIFCSTDLLTDSFAGCSGLVSRGLSAEQTCSKCAHQKADNMWALRWFDSLGKPPAGITEGNYYWLGDYEMCSAMRSEGIFKGQYCRAEIEVPDALVESGCPQTDPLSIVVGVCFPSSCSIDQLTKVSQLYSPYKVKIECESDSSWSLVTYMLLTAFLIWMVPQIVATVQDGSIDSVLGCFSISENAKRSFSTRRDTQDLHLVHGLEFLTYFAIITGMVYNLMLPYIENVAFSFEAVGNPWMHLVNNYSFHIDGLLALSAFYTTYLLYGEIESKRQAFDYIAMRFCRFWPAYVVCILFMYCIFPGISFGPMWIHTDTVERCEASWWKNVLFINNWYNVTDTCVDFGYVISLEAQYYMLLIVLIWLSRSYALYTQIAAYLCIIVQLAVTFYRAYSGSLPPAPMLTLEPVPTEQTYAIFNQLLLSPVGRISAYCIGFIFGIGCSSSTAENPLRTSGLSYKWHKVLALMCISCAAFPLYGAFSYAAHATEGPVFSAFYAAFHRPMWAFALMSFIYLCHHGAFTWINALLGWRVFAPLSKLTWIALVLAEPIILYFFSSLNKPAYATHWSTLYTVISAGVSAYLMAMAIDIFITRPIRYLIYREQKHRYAQAHTEASRP